MSELVEISSLDLRYQGYRMRNRTAEKTLLVSMTEQGIRDPLQGVDTTDCKILLNGFKRYRCAKKLGMRIVPYRSLSDDEACGILELLRIANAKSLSILEQAKLIDELLSVHGLCNASIAHSLEKSRAWVSVRTGLISEMTPIIIEKIMSGAFPAYSYMYTLRQFMRINAIEKKEVEKFVQSVSGKDLSTRDIEALAHGYFKGSQEMHQQIEKGDIAWALRQVKHSTLSTPGCNSAEQAMLNDLDIIQKQIRRIISKSQDERITSPSFYAQAELLTGGILRQMDVFSQTLKAFHDKSRQAQSDLPSA